MLLNLIYYLLIGSIVGVLSGLLGIGGGVIVVPLLVFVYTLQHIPDSLIMHMAVATSLTAMIATTASAVAAHHRYGSNIWPVFRLLAPGAAIGAILGAVLAHKLPTHLLKMIFGFFALLIAIHMFTQRQTKTSHQLPKKTSCYSAGIVLGVLSGLLGIGGGTFIVPFLTYCNVSMRDIVGISAACGLVVAIISTLSFMVLGALHSNLPSGSTGYIYWPAVICIVITSPLFAILGANLSHRLPVKRLRQIFAVFLLGMAIYML